MKPSTWLLAATAFLVSASVRPMVGQIGGIARRAASSATQSNVKNGAITVPANERITPAVLDQLNRGLNAMTATLDSARTLKAGMKSPEVYQQCAGQFMSGPEMQRITAAYRDAAAAAGSNVDKATAAATKFSDDMRKGVDTKCGADPSSGAAAINRDYNTRALNNAYKASGLDGEAWARVKERVPPFCNLPASKRGNGDVRAEGQYVYLASEAQAIAPRCAALMPKLNATN